LVAEKRDKDSPGKARFHRIQAVLLPDPPVQRRDVAGDWTKDDASGDAKATAIIGDVLKIVIPYLVGQW